MELTAIILAAGRGTRLEPYTSNRPKCLATLGGRSLIERQIETLRSAGISRIIIAAGYRAEMLRFADTDQVINPAWDTTNMVETLWCANDRFGNDLIVSYGDIVYEDRVLKALLDSPHPCSVVVDRAWKRLWDIRFDDPLDDAETLRLDGSGKIVEIGQKPTSLDDIEAQYIGLMRFQGPGLKWLRAGYAHMQSAQHDWMKKRPVRNAYMTDLLTELIGIGFPVHAVPIQSGWLEIDTVHDLEIAEAMILDGSIAPFFEPDADRESKTP